MNLIFPTWYFRNQVNINTVLVEPYKQITCFEKLCVKAKLKYVKLFWPHCGVNIGSELGGSTCDFWIIGPKGSKLVVLILTLILAWMKDGYFDRNIPHYHLCSKSLAAIYNFTITKTLEFSVPGLKLKWGLSFHYLLYCFTSK